MGRLPLVTRVGAPLLALAMLPGTAVPLSGVGRTPGPDSPSASEPVTAAVVGTVPATTVARWADAWPRFPTCDPTTPDGRAGSAAGAGTAAAPDRASQTPAPAGTWWRLDPVLDEAGWLTGQRLAVGRVVGGTTRTTETLDLPAESVAAGPVLGQVVVAADDGHTSSLTVLDLERSCRLEIATERDIVRRAVLAPDGGAIYEFRLARATRADEGVWVRELAAPWAARRVLDPIEDDGRFGPTWTTSLSFDETGERLIVESCGERACRVRIVDPATGEVTLHADPELGELVGVTNSQVFVRAACPGLPCPVLRLDESGARSVVVEEAALAVLVAGPDGPRLIAERPDGRQALVVEPASGAIEGAIDLAPGERLVPAQARALSGIELRSPTGHRSTPAMTSRDGRLGDGVPFRPLDPTVSVPAEAEEVLP